MVDCEICILAGGESRRMGRDKARLKLGRETLLSRIKAAARRTGWPVRVVRRDVVVRCGPLGGVFTALETTSHAVLLFLPCDMPWLGTAFIEWMAQKFCAAQRPVFCAVNRVPGFPFILSRDVKGLVDRQLARKEFSLHRLARVLGAKLVRVPERLRYQLQNVNTPADWHCAQQMWARCKKPRAASASGNKGRRGK